MQNINPSSTITLYSIHLIYIHLATQCRSWFLSTKSDS